MYSWFTQSNYLSQGGGGASGQPAPGSTGVRGHDGDGILWVQAALLGTASSSTGYFSVQPGNSNPFGIPIDTSTATYGGGAVNGLKIPFDYELKEVLLSVSHCAVGASSASSTVYLNLDCHVFQGESNSAIGTVRVPLSGAKCGVFNNLGADNFQKAVVTGITGISGAAGDLFGFRFRNVLSSSDVNSVSRCTVLVKLQRINWTPGGDKGDTGVQGIMGDTGLMGVTGPYGGPLGATGMQGVTGLIGATGIPGVPGDYTLWAQASLLGTAVSTVGFYSVQGGVGNPSGVPISSTSSSYGAGGVQALKLPWPYVVSEVHMASAHMAVSTATPDTSVNFNLDFHRYRGSSSSLVGSVSVPVDGALCGSYNNLGGDSYQGVKVDGLGLTGPENELVGWSFRNVGGPSDVNAVSRSTVLVKFQKQGSWPA